MKRIATIISYCFILQTTSAQTFNPLLAEMLQDTLDTYVTAITNIKGMSASVYYPGQGIWTGTSGLSYDGEPITSDKQFGIASNTKLFVSTVMLKLDEENILSLDDSIHEWLPDYTNVDPDITIRQLLNHTSGISDPIFVSPWMDTIADNPTRVFTSEEVLSWLGPALFEPGTGWNYSNVNYILTGMIAESASGFTISELIREYILTPIDMDSTFYDVEEPINGILAHRWYNTFDYHDTSRVGLNSAGGCAGSLFSTSGEMVQWYHALMNGEIINATSLAEMSNFVNTGVVTYDYGLGIARETTLERSYWGHGGSTWGYKSKTIYDTCMQAVVCGLTNSWPAGDDGVVFLLYSVLLHHIPTCAGMISGSTTVCQGDLGVNYTVPPITNATSYVWTLPSGATGLSESNSITVDYGLSSISGNITVAGVSDYGVGTTSILPITVNTKPEMPVITQIGNTLHSDAVIGNQWYNSSGAILGAVNQDYVFSIEDDYYDIVSISGCNGEASEIIHVIPSTNNILEELNTIHIYPNPANEFLNIELTVNLPNTNFELFDIYGKLILYGTLKKNTVIPLRNLVGGIYFIKISSDNFYFLKSFVKNNP